MREVRPTLRPSLRARKWERQVQAPFIRGDGTRTDKDWDWLYQIPVLTFAVGAGRRPRLFQLSLSQDDFPIGMVALLEHERWPRDQDLPAVFVWYMTGAPHRAVCGRGGPRLLTTATLDIAVTVGLNGAARGRLWLHAAPEGGLPLLRWYHDKGLEMVPPDLVLPSSRLVPRENDGRYLQLTGCGAAAFSRRLDGYRS